MNDSSAAGLPLFDQPESAPDQAQQTSPDKPTAPANEKTSPEEGSSQREPSSQTRSGASPSKKSRNRDTGRSRGGETNPQNKGESREDTREARSERAESREGSRRDQRGGGPQNQRRKKNKRGNKERKKDVPTGPPVEGEGLLEISTKGFGFLRQADSDFQQAPNDIFVTPEMVRNYGMRDGMWLKCVSREGNRGPQLSEILEICGKKPDQCQDLPYFEELTAINPNKRIILETRQDLYTTRVMDMITPLGRGQRGLIVAPPRTGKTTLLQHMAEAVHHNHDYIKVMVLLVDERPEEVTELRRALPFADVMASSNDQDVKSHTRIAQLAIERCKRLVEAGEHVFLLLDSITRMARAFNNSIKSGGNRGTASGGLAVGALEVPRRLFAAARNTREAGSLTIIGTALVETSSRMDDAIFQEFKGTGNMELVLDRKIAERYVWPAVNIHASGTRREELLLPPHQLEKIYVIRRGLAGHKPIEAIERLLSLMERFPNNAQMLLELKSGGS